MLARLCCTGAHIDYTASNERRYLIFLGRQLSVERLVNSATGQRLHYFWYQGWRMDDLYDWLWVRPFQATAHLLRDEPVDLLYNGIVKLNVSLHHTLSNLQTGRMRWYASAMVSGLILLLGLLLGVR